MVPIFCEQKEFHPGQFQLDTESLVQRFNQSLEITGACIPVCYEWIGYGGSIGYFLRLEKVSGNIFRRLGKWDDYGGGELWDISNEVVKITLI
jgi:hypothetical protein